MTVSPATGPGPVPTSPSRDYSITSLCTRIAQTANQYLCCGICTSPSIVTVSRGQFPQQYEMLDTTGPSQQTDMMVGRAASPKPSTRQVEIRCAGMSNSNNYVCLNKCYFNAVIKSLWATPGMHNLITQKAHETPPNEMAQHLLSLFTELSSRTTTISHTHPDIVAILTLVNNDQFHALENKQQDAQELLIAICSHLLFTPEPDLSPDEISIARMFSMTGLYTIKEIPHRQPSPTGINLYIPNIDHGEQSNQRCFTSHIPEGSLSWSLDKMFGPLTKTETMDEYINIRNNERNESLTEDQIRTEMGRLGNEVQAETKFEFSAPPPQFFPIQLARFSFPKTKEESIEAIQKAYSNYGQPITKEEILESVKRSVASENRRTHQKKPLPQTLEEVAVSDLTTVYGAPKKTEAVFPPLVLNAPCEGKAEPIPYHLKSIVVQMGISTNSGHYYTYVPDPSSPLETLPAYDPTDPNDPFKGKEFPSRWIKHEDGNVSEVNSHQVVSDIARNGYLFMYEKAT